MRRIIDNLRFRIALMSRGQIVDLIIGIIFGFVIPTIMFILFFFDKGPDGQVYEYLCYPALWAGSILIDIYHPEFQHYFIIAFIVIYLQWIFIAAIIIAIRKYVAVKMEEAK